MSMQPIVFKVALFRGDFDQARSQYSLLWMMEALVRINQSHIRQFRGLAHEGKVPAPYPLLYRSGVHYEPEPGTEEWLDIPNILDSRGGTFPGPWCDCEDLACWRAAELREDPHKPVKAKPFAKWRKKPDGSYAYHALVLLPDGRLEDPSLVLGMGNEPEFAQQRLAERYKEGSLTPNVKFAKAPDVVVVDPDSEGGFSKDIRGARKRTGVLADVTRPPAGAPITGLITGRMPAGGASTAFPEERTKAVSNEDGSIYAPISAEPWQKMAGKKGAAAAKAPAPVVSGDEPAAWGYDRSSVDLGEMRELAALQQREGRLRRGGNPHLDWTRQLNAVMAPAQPGLRRKRIY